MLKYFFTSLFVPIGTVDFKTKIFWLLVKGIIESIDLYTALISGVPSRLEGVPTARKIKSASLISSVNECEKFNLPSILF